MPSFYPRKQTTLIFIVSLICVAATAAYVNGQQAKTASRDGLIAGGSAKSAATGEAAQAEKNLEQIARTGAWRSAFFEAGAASSSSFAASTNVATASSGPLTATDKLGRDFFARYVELRQTGQNTNANAVSEVASQLIDDSLSNLPSPKSHSLSEIRVSQTATSREGLASYGKNVYGIVTNAVPAKEQNEAAVAMQALDSDNMGLLKGIDKNISGYRSAIRSLLALQAPKELAQPHLDLINAFELSLMSAQSFRSADTDPVQSLTAIESEIKSLQKMQGAYDAIKQYFIASGVPFGY